MKNKFDANVAADLPKTKAREPELPWKVNVDAVSAASADAGGALSEELSAPPLRTRAIFPILLVVTIFFTMLYIAGDIAMRNAAMESSVMRNEHAIASLRVNLEKMRGERNTLTESTAQMKKRIDELSDQKEVFTTVLEGFSKKTDDLELDETKDNIPSAPADGAPAQRPAV